MIANYDDKPVPKVIDFGVAKAMGTALIDDAPVTMFGSIVGTLHYMSPEQATFNALDVDTRTDVYALGALLYEIFTGEPPLKEQLSQKVAIQKLLETIREQEPMRPSTRISRSTGNLHANFSKVKFEQQTLSRIVRRELDLIVMKALEKKRSRRYQSADDLARDINRYLDGDPVEACPPTMRYRAGKFLRRHRKPVIAASLLVLLLVAGVIGTSLGLARAIRSETKVAKALTQERQARKEADAARLEADKARRIAETEIYRTRRSDYAHRIALSQTFIQSGDIGSARTLLEGCREEFRHFEWHRLRGLLDNAKLTLLGHHDPVKAIAISRDGKRIVSGPSERSALFSFFPDQTIRVWDVESNGKLLFELDGHEDKINSLAISPDGKRVVSGSSDKTIKVWDMEAGGEALLTLVGHQSSVTAVVFSVDGQKIISGDAHGVIQIWDANKKENSIRALWGHETGISDLAVSPDGQRVISASWDKSLKVWPLEGKEEALFTLEGHTQAVTCVAISPDGKHIVSGSIDETLQVWHAKKDGDAIFTLMGHTGRVDDVAFILDGHGIVSGSADGMLKIWDSQMAAPAIRTLRGHDGAVYCLAASEDDLTIVSGGDDETIKIWHADPESIDGTFMLQPKKLGFIRGFVFSPDSRRVALPNNDGDIEIWSADPNGKKLVTMSGYGLSHADIVFGPNGNRIISASKDNVVKVWDAVNGGDPVLTLRGHVDQISSIAVNPKGDRIASGDTDGIIKIWDAFNGGAALMTLRGRNDNRVDDLAFSPDGKRLNSVAFRSLTVWDAEQPGKALRTFNDLPSSEVASVFSPDGKRIAYGANEDDSIKIVDTENGEISFDLLGHRKAPLSLAFSADGKRVVSIDEDLVLKMWDAERGGPALLTFTLEVFESRMSKVSFEGISYPAITFAPDSKRIAMGFPLGNVVLFWDSFQDRNE